MPQHRHPLRAAWVVFVACLCTTLTGVFGGTVPSECQTSAPSQGELILTDCHMFRGDVLDLHQAGLTGILQGAFAGTTLTKLYLSDNALTSLPTNVFADASQITHLRLDGNQLTELPYGLFDPLVRLQFLTFNDNALTTLHWRLFEAVGDTLTDLDASNNRFTTLDTRLFQSTPLLKQLSLSGNPFDVERLIPEGLFANLDQLQYPWWKIIGPPYSGYVPGAIPAYQDTFHRTLDGTHAGTNVAN